jgi:soluble lytic murein transglycosylase
MTTPYPLMLALFVAAVAVPAKLARQAPEGGDRLSEPDGAAPAVEAAAQGRHGRASRVLGEYLAVAAATPSSPSAWLPARADEPSQWAALGRLMDGAGPRSWGTMAGGNGGLGWTVPGWGRQPGLEGGDDASWDQGLDYLRRGLTAGSAGQVVAAVAALDRAAEALPWMADWASYFVAEALAPAGDTAGVRRRLEAAGPALAARGWRLEVRAAREAGDLSRARRVALATARKSAASSNRAEAWVMLGGLRLLAGDTAGAREAYRSAMEGAPASMAAVDAARGLARLGPRPEEWRRIASTYLRHGNQARAIAGFDAYLSSGAGSAQERARVRLQRGQALLDGGRPAEGELYLLALSEEPVPARIAAEAVYLAGRAQYRQGRVADAKRTFARAGARFPGQDGTARALYLLADLQHDDLELEAARSNYRRAATAASTLHEAGLALIRLGGLKYLAGEYEAAADVFEEYRGYHARGRRISHATYWAARSYLAAGRDTAAIPLLRKVRRDDPLSYHGIRAGELLGERALAIPMEPEPPRSQRTDSLVQLALRRVDALEQLGRRADLAHEVETIRELFARADGGDYALAEGLSERGHTLPALAIGWDIFRREGAWNPRLLRVIYPFPFQELVREAADVHGLDPYLVAAVIRRESAFNPSVSSSAGAIGLMQIMPRTGQGLARSAGLTTFHPEMLMQPDLNVRLGVDYLASLMDRFAGDIPLALAAYNAGPSRARRWQQLPEARDPELLMERFPFDETRDYVRHVKLNRALYRELYPHTHVQLGNRDR